MAYTPTDWKCGQTVTVEKLNNIERGVAEVNSEYTPTTWQCGDVITAEKMNKIEQGIANAGGGGGGSSDFSTATVTVANSAGSQFLLSHLLPFGDGSFPAVDATGNIQAILYNGSAIGLILGGTVTIEGSATYSAPLLTVTGDCTITIS